MRSPFMGIIFALELTHDVNALLPLLVAVVISYGFTVLVMRRSILTEKVSRRGYHLSSEYATDPLEIIFVREVMRTDILALAATASLAEIEQALQGKTDQKRLQHLFPILDPEQRLVGVITRKALQEHIRQEGPASEDEQLRELIATTPIVAYTDEPLRSVVYRMAETGFTRFPVVDRDNPQKLLGIVSLGDLLKARARNLIEERQRERVLRIRMLLPRRTQSVHPVNGPDQLDSAGPLDEAEPLNEPSPVSE